MKHSVFSLFVKFPGFWDVILLYRDFSRKMFFQTSSGTTLALFRLTRNRIASYLNISDLSTSYWLSWIFFFYIDNGALIRCGMKTLWKKSGFSVTRNRVSNSRIWPFHFDCNWLCRSPGKKSQIELINSVDGICTSCINLYTTSGFIPLSK